MNPARMAIRYGYTLIDKAKDAFEHTTTLLNDRLLMPVITPTLSLPPEVNAWKVIFVGASVGSAWRLDLVYPQISMCTAYSFDKRAAVERAIAERPDAIILKECAAYFPSAEEDRGAFRSWVDRIALAGIAPIPATVVPVTEEHALRHPGRSAGIASFNDWLRDISYERQWPLLDLERSLRVHPQDRHLRPDLHSGDGLHLSRETYRDYLDHLIGPALLDGHRYRRGRDI